MKLLTRLAVASTASVVFGAATTFAQDGPPRFNPIQIYGCNFVGGNDMTDVNPIFDELNEWMDADGVDDTTLLTMTPFYQSADFPYDFIILGAWPSGASMGAGLHAWVNESGDLPGQFQEVIECPLHQGMASLLLNEPSAGDGGGNGGSFVTSFSNCSVADGRTPPEAVGGIREWIDYEQENGLDRFHFIAVPGPGEAADADYTFKWISAYANYQTVGQSFEISVNDGGLARNNEIFSRLMSCDSARIYNARFVRQAAN